MPVTAVVGSNTLGETELCMFPVVRSYFMEHLFVILLYLVDGGKSW